LDEKLSSRPNATTVRMLDTDSNAIYKTKQILFLNCEILLFLANTGMFITGGPQLYIPAIALAFFPKFL